MESIFIFIVVVAGFAWYIKIARNHRTSRVESFFVGGRNIGFPLFTQTTWGTSFAFGNSIFYAIWLGYTIGLSAIWIQALWAVGMCLYAALLPKLVRHTEKFTLHGFLGSVYGETCRKLASIVSVFGLIICLGFEVSFAAQYFAQVTHIQNLEWLIVLLFGTFVATFSSIGGFNANTVTDRYTNRIAFVAMGLLIVVMFLTHSDTAALSGAAITTSLTNFSDSSPIFLLGLGFFALFNFVDMSNWQNVSANSLAVENSLEATVQRKRMRLAMFKAAGLFLLAPVLLGTFLGYMLKVSQLGTMEQPTFMSQLVFDIAPAIPLVSALFFSVVTFAFLAASLSGSDSWLLAIAQTLSWDLIDHKKFKAANFKVDNFDTSLHEKITRRARRMLLVAGIGGASVVYYISKYVWNDIFALQFVIFGGGLAMLPALLYGILVLKNPIRSKILSITAVLSIVLGYSFALFLFVFSLAKKDSDIVNWVPLCALGTSLGVFIIGATMDLLIRKNEAG